jgi:hypothetical protein
MKKSGYIALGGISAALSLVCMLLAWFPYFTYALPMLAGCAAIPLVYEINRKYAFTVYLVSAIISFFICEKEAAILYIFFFGIYPIVKSLFETKIKKRPAQYILKYLFFNCSVIIAYLLIVFVFSIPFGMGDRFGRFTVAVMFVIANIIFTIYDIMLSRVVVFYANRLHKTVIKLIGR